MANITKTLHEKMVNTQLGNDQTKNTLGALIRKEFDNPETSQERAEDLLCIAYQLGVPQFEEMLFDYRFEDFKL